MVVKVVVVILAGGDGRGGWCKLMGVVGSSGRGGGGCSGWCKLVAGVGGNESGRGGGSSGSARVTVNSPLRFFSMAEFASSSEMPSRAVVRSSIFVITSVTFICMRSPVIKSMSRDVTMPRSLPPINPVSVTGKLE